MSRIVARLLSHAPLFLAGLLIIGAVDTVHAQNIAVSKDLCGPAVVGGGPCIIANGALPIVAPQTQVWYQLQRGSAAGRSRHVGLLWRASEHPTLARHRPVDDSIRLRRMELPGWQQ